jgi:hypothetical protein
MTCCKGILTFVYLSQVTFSLIMINLGISSEGELGFSTQFLLFFNVLAILEPSFVCLYARAL